MASKDDADSPAKAMESAIAAGDWQRADRYSKRVLMANPDDPDVVTRVATVAAFCDRKSEAAMMLVEAAKLADYQPASRVNFAVQALIEVGQVYAAIDLLEQALAAHPDDDAQRRILVGFLTEVQRTDRVSEHLMQLIQHRKFDLPLLTSTTETSSRRLSDQTSQRLLERHPDDRRVLLSDAFLHLYRRDAQSAAEILADILKHHPEFAPAHAMYGQALAASGRWAELANWSATAVEGSSDFADYWLTLGDAATKNDQPAEAVRAYWEATRRDPNSTIAWDRLRVAVDQLRSGDSSLHDSVDQTQLSHITDRVNGLLAFREAFNDFAGDGQQSQMKATKMAQTLMGLGRLWEAEAWSAIATTLTKDPSPELAGLRREILGRLKRHPGWVDWQNPALAVDLSFLPEPKLNPNWDLKRRSNIVPALASTNHLRLSEQSELWGLHAIGQGNTPTKADQMLLVRSTGVGGGAIDFDLDGRPDLVVMNAGGQMLAQDSMPNELLRNLGDRFVRVVSATGIADRGYGQGVAVGDFNEDGFPDLFLANLGNNRLLRNNGDGSFSDCTDQMQGAAANAWSTSGAFVDINQDGISDLVVTHYCQAVADLARPCQDANGVSEQCHPLTFPADTDQFFVGDGSGGLSDVTHDWAEDPLLGRGLGVVAGTIANDQLGIFVANDMTRNAYYSRSSGPQMGLTESASARGVSVDGRTRAQASMGIASSDFDGDGDLDFYVTGFAREYNVYYEQVSPGLWKDETGTLGLVQPTLEMIGFGTQAIDLENDGIDEIIVTNGHIGEFSSPDAPPYELPLQIFRRGGQGSFELLDDDQWGDYFRTPHVGRALWTTDVNRDGRNDVMITHANEQIRLLINESKTDHHRIAFQLVGVNSSRSAIGAVIRFQCNGQRRTLWSLSGNGYFCSNENTLLAGLRQADRITDVTVRWQDGSVERLDTLPADHQYLIVQGSGEAFPLFQYDR
ncbi:FG-GAP-like repeat-containing protein [Stieleria sp. TO1_6]|uniref:FG-GAP-like repeat-containing protein n=1 Tax=Stieleria tagensis TaxID=2956795 RepID=UPI00209ACDB2|nr:FG-GAP-like repeat-containing protein [Stieleria tagensis]MCO8122298.1 FG-GAP-like repeat-containing protein [Stieleria tagensis]